MAVPTLYTARFDLPDLIERNRDTDLVCRTYRAGAIATPTSGTITIYDRSDTVIVNAAAVTISGGWATYTVAAATTSALELEDGWRVEWTLAMPDGETHTFRNEGVLCRCAPAPVVTEETLYARCPALRPKVAGGRNPISARSEYAEVIDEAWIELSNHLLSEAARPERVLSPSAMRHAHLSLTLALVYEDLAGRNNPAHIEMARHYRELYSSALARLDLAYDADDDGRADERRGARGPVWLM
jgi:hypothetical protein